MQDLSEVDLIGPELCYTTGGDITKVGTQKAFRRQIRKIAPQVGICTYGDDLSDHFVENISDSEEVLFGDDTDNDPNYELSDQYDSDDEVIIPTNRVSIIEDLSKECFSVRNQTTTSPRGATPREAGDGPQHVRKFGLGTLPDKKQRNCCVCSKERTSSGGKRKKSRTTPFEKINIRKKEHGRPLENLANVPQDLVYHTSRPINMAKKDMMDLLKFIPPVHHNYYKNLKTERGVLENEPGSDDDCITYSD
ncbi:hypothetical protein J6590_076769 [Homalodisca vitripennis]|nr:hypothetical protein J6590_076769 [Homalodisca vitripennis]